MLSIYLAFLEVSFKRQITYRIANWAGLFTNAFFLFFKVALFEAIYVGNEVVGGLNSTSAMAYAGLAQVLVMVIPQWGNIGVGEEIRSGQVAIDMCRPVNYYFLTMSKRLGISLYYVLMRAMPLAALGIFVGILIPFKNLAHIPLFIISVVMGSWIANSYHFLVETSAFWIENARGLKTLSTGIIYFLSGIILPINFFPVWAQNISRFLPFEYTINVPIQIYLGTGSNIFELMFFQLIWCLVMSAQCIWVLSKGENQLTVHGG
ncbi:MAG: hypothetical protein HOE90_24925 [Bacteriovoracaceae bacterium]|jgi:ABC-2 type transport system permease protein|nr:hypothetical protein [Bacteriovoracaceae bacterium]